MNGGNDHFAAARYLQLPSHGHFLYGILDRLAAERALPHGHYWYVHHQRLAAPIMLQRCSDHFHLAD